MKEDEQAAHHTLSRWPRGAGSGGKRCGPGKSQGLGSGGTGDPTTALPLRTKVQKRSRGDSNGFRFELAPEQEQAYKNSFNPYTNSIKSGKHTTQNAVCSRVCPCESAAGRLQEISVRSGPGSSASLGVDLSPPCHCRVCYSCLSFGSRSQDSDNYRILCSQGAPGCSGKGESQAECELSLAGDRGLAGDD